MNTKKLFIACVCSLFMLAAHAQTQVIAHRGFWKAEGSAQNSITALKKAAEAEVYGSEFDVQLTVDGVVVVNHDETIAGLTIGKTPYNHPAHPRNQAASYPSAGGRDSRFCR